MINELTELLHMPNTKGSRRKAKNAKTHKGETEAAPHSRQ